MIQGHLGKNLELKLGLVYCFNMADSSKASGIGRNHEETEKNNRFRAVQLLQEATKLLTSSPAAKSPSPSSFNANSAPDVIGSLRNLFSPYSYGKEQSRSQSSAYQTTTTKRQRMWAWKEKNMFPFRCQRGEVRRKGVC